MRKWSAILAVFLGLSLSFPVHAQNAGTLSSVHVEIWPEYDQPAVLVIYSISLSPSTGLPALITVRIPAGAEVYAVAVADPVKGLLNAPYDRSVEGSWATLKITADLPSMQIEYYDSLNKTGTARHIVFEWPGDYAVDGFSVAFQQPVGATGLAIYPSLVKGTDRGDGFTYFISSPVPLKPGQAYTLTVDYQKASDTLSTTGLPVQPVEPLSASTPGRVTMSGILPWVLAGLGTVLVLIGILGGIYIWKNGTRKVRSPGKTAAGPVLEQDNGLVYCPKCGKRAQAGDFFCRTCGARLVRDESQPRP